MMCEVMWDLDKILGTKKPLCYKRILAIKGHVITGLYCTYLTSVIFITNAGLYSSKVTRIPKIRGNIPLQRPITADGKNSTTSRTREW